MNINEDFEIRQLLMQATEVCPFSDEKWAVQDRRIGWSVLTPSRGGGKFQEFLQEPVQVPNLGLQGCSLPSKALRCDLGLSPSLLS